MKKNKIKILFVICVILIFTLPITSFAHSGRTDSQGGHHDYKNKSGLGNYHYHHGYPAHLHPGGVCPYSNENNNSVNGNNSQESTYTPPAPSITIKNYPKTLDVGTSAGFEYSVSNATDNNSTVTSSDPNVVKVNSNGTLTAVSEGNAEITVNASGITKSFSIKVNAVPVEEVKISNAIKQLQLGDLYQFQTVILPNNATNKEISWSSDNEKVVKINNSGVVTAESTGIATVTATTENNIEAKTTIEVYEVFPDKIDCKESINLIVGDTDVYEIEILPKNSNNKDFTVVCDNEKILKYSNSTIYAVSVGESTLHIETWNGIKKDIPIKVDIIPIEKINIKDTTEYIFSNIIDKTSKISLSTEIVPSNATYQEIVWKSSDDEIVSIQDNNFIVIGTGKVTLTYTAHDGTTGNINITIINKDLIITIFVLSFICVIVMVIIFIKIKHNKKTAR